MANRTTRSRRRRRRHFLWGLLMWGLVGALGVATVSSFVGGPIRFVVVRGDSMLPNYVSGDLIITQNFSPPKRGQVIAYHFQEDNGKTFHVIHRIVGEKDGKFETRGDNRDANDSWHPTRSQVDGHAWIRIPGAGQWLAGPLIKMLIAAALGLVVSASFWVSDSDDEPDEPSDQDESDVDENGVRAIVVSVRPEPWTGVRDGPVKELVGVGNGPPLTRSAVLPPRERAHPPRAREPVRPVRRQRRKSTRISIDWREPM